MSLLFALVSGAMTMLGLFLSSDGGIFGLVAGGIGAVFFGLATLKFLLPLFSSGPVVAIGPEGILCRQWSYDLIPWRAIKRVRAPMGDRMVSFWLVDPASFRFKPLQRLMRRLDPEKQYSADLAVMTVLLNCSADDLAEAVHLHRPSLFGRRR